jgi:hypothetical protein
MSRMAALLEIFKIVKPAGWTGRRSAILPGGGTAAHFFLVSGNDNARVNSLGAMQLLLSFEALLSSRRRDARNSLDHDELDSRHTRKPLNLPDLNLNYAKFRSHLHQDAPPALFEVAMLG